MEMKEKDMRKSRLIFDARIARKLLKQGFVVIDIKPNRENVEKSIFVFENTEEFQQALTQLMDVMKTKKEAEAECERLTIDID